MPTDEEKRLAIAKAMGKSPVETIEESHYPDSRSVSVHEVKFDPLNSNGDAFEVMCHFEIDVEYTFLYPNCVRTAYDVLYFWDDEGCTKEEALRCAIFEAAWKIVKGN